MSQLDQLDDLGLDKDYLVKELGCESKKVLMDEELLDQFIVLKAIIDKNLPKLLFKDVSILHNIVSDVFPNIPNPSMRTKNNVIEMIDERLDKWNFYRGDDFIQNIYFIYEALESRHGIMVVGQPTTGKSTSISILEDVMRQLQLREFQQKRNHFLRTKAQKLGIPVKT